MDATNPLRQDRFRQKKKSEGKRQRAFFLSDAALQRIKIHKDEFRFENMNQALESLLTSPNLVNCRLCKKT